MINLGELKAVKRLEQEDVWIGLKLDGEFIKKQKIVFEDLQFVNDHSQSIEEISGVFNALHSRVQEYYKG